jgi:HK97 family phage major capsid protein
MPVALEALVPETDSAELTPVEEKLFPLPYVEKLRSEAASYRVKAKEATSSMTKGYLPKDVHEYNTDLNVYINHFPRGDAENFSVARAAYAKAQSNDRFTGRAWDVYAPWEKQYLDALSKVRYKAQGDQISGIDGGFLAPEIWNVVWFDLLRNKAAIDNLPVTRFSVDARVVQIPRIHTDISVIYPGENAQITASQFSFGQVGYTAHKAAALVNLSNELIRDAGDLADQILRTSSAGAIATDRDTQLFIGTAAGPGPLGLVNHPIIANNFTFFPVTSVTGNITSTPASFVPSYQHVAQMIAKVDTLFGFSGNAATLGQANCNGVVANPQFKQTVYASTRFQDSSARPLWVEDLNAGRGPDDSGAPSKTRQGGFFGQNWALTGVIPTNLTRGGGSSESEMIFGQWDQYCLFECLTLGFDATSLSGSSTVGFGADQTQVRVVHRYDGAPVQPSAFGVLAGVLV